MTVKKCFNYTEDSCLDPYQRTGQCISIKACPPLVEILKRKVTTSERNLLQRSQCGWDDNIPRVCCANTDVRYPTPGFTNVRPISNVNQPTTGTTTVNRSPLLPTVGHCGIQIGNRIFGGKSTQLDEFPWLALLRYLKRK